MDSKLPWDLRTKKFFFIKAYKCLDCKEYHQEVLIKNDEINKNTVTNALSNVKNMECARVVDFR